MVIAVINVLLWLTTISTLQLQTTDYRRVPRKTDPKQTFELTINNLWEVSLRSWGLV